LYATKLTDRVYLLDTHALGYANVVGVYVIKGEKPAIVDCGYASSYENVLAGLSEIGLSPSEIRYIIPTHVHLDHAGAAGHLMRAMPNAELIAQERGIPHLADPAHLVESATRVFGSVIMELYGAPVPVPSERITAVGEEMHLDLGGNLTATLIHAPGHAPHQLCALLENAKILLTGDAVGIVYPWLNVLIPATPPPSFNPEALVHTVRQLEQTTPEELLVPHFGRRNDVGQVFENTRTKVLQWVRETRDLKNKGMGLDEISEAMEAKIKSEAAAGDLSIYARVMVRTSVMGILHYLEKNP
jgi:glyoxylase-like metal-dependent hydrolase (beta-lactamase superfamily II)